MEVNLYLEMLTSEKHRGRKEKPERRGRKGGEGQRTRKDEKFRDCLAISSSLWRNTFLF